MRTTLVVANPTGEPWTRAQTEALVGLPIREGRQPLGRVVAVAGTAGREALLEVELDALTAGVLNVGMPAVSIRAYMGGSS